MTPAVSTVDGSATTAPRRTPGASSSRKVLQLLLAFSERRWEASVAELAATIGTPVATTEGSGNPRYGYIAYAFLASLAIFVVCKSSRRS